VNCADVISKRPVPFAAGKEGAIVISKSSPGSDNANEYAFELARKVLLHDL
jgi:hypothetical protein